MKRIHRTHRGVAVAAAIVAAIFIAACGGSSNSSSGSKSKTSTTSSRTALAACLKKHGVTLPAGFGGRGTGTGTPGTGTPPSGGALPGGGNGGAPSGGGAPGAGGGFPGGGGSSKLQTTLKVCGAKFGTGAPGGGAVGARQPTISTKALRSYVACIRKHGYAGMPEPNTSGKGSVFPASVEKNTAFKKANTKCESVLRSALSVPSGGAAGSGVSTTTS